MFQENKVTAKVTNDQDNPSHSDEDGEDDESDEDDRDDEDDEFDDDDPPLTACYNCENRLWFHIEQNICHRACLVCGHFTCLMCSMQSHFPATCTEVANVRNRIYHVDAVRAARFRGVLDVMDHYLSECFGLATPFDRRSLGLALEFHIHPYLFRASRELIRMCLILTSIQFFYIANQQLELQLAVAHRNMMQSFVAFFQAFPRPDTPLNEWDRVLIPRNNAAASTISFLMAVLRARTV